MATRNFSVGFSIVIPIYNSETYLETAIQSILNNEYKNLEIILVDDGSTDNSLNLCKKYANIDKRIKVIKISENKGVVNACKQGVLAASYQYISFLDSDDYVSKSLYEKVASIILEYNPDMVVFGMKSIDVNGVEKEIPINFKGVCGYIGETEYSNAIRQKLISKNKLNDELMHFYKTNKIFRRDMLLRNFDLIDENVYIFDGYLFSLPVLLDCKSIYFLCEPLYSYRIRYNSAIHTKSPQQIISNHYFYNAIEKIFKKKIYDDRLDIFLLSICLSSINRILESNVSLNEKIESFKTLKTFPEIKHLFTVLNSLTVNNDIKNIIKVLELFN